MAALRTRRSGSGGHRPPLQNERGVALVLTLAILALVTLLVIAFVTSMRIENMALKNYNEVYKARELARGAVNQAVGQIRAATPLPSSVAQSYYVTGTG